MPMRLVNASGRHRRTPIRPDRPRLGGRHVGDAQGDPMTEPTTHTLDVPGAVLTYDVRPERVRPPSRSCC